MPNLPIFTGPDGMPVQPTQDHLVQAISLLYEEIGRLQRENQMLKDRLQIQEEVSDKDYAKRFGL